jgi:transcriptional regulator with XRE-family HTH domain
MKNERSGKMPVGRPQENAKTGPTYELAEWLNANLPRRTNMTNEELADDMGYARSNIISMWRTGKSRIPLERLPDLSRLLNVSMAELMPMWVEQYAPQIRVEVGKMFNRLVTENEFEVIEAIRQASESTNPKPSRAQLKAVREAFAK